MNRTNFLHYDPVEIIDMAAHRLGIDIKISIELVSAEMLLEMAVEDGESVAEAKQTCFIVSDTEPGAGILTISVDASLSDLYNAVCEAYGVLHIGGELGEPDVLALMRLIELEVEVIATERGFVPAEVDSALRQPEVDNLAGMN